MRKKIEEMRQSRRRRSMSTDRQIFNTENDFMVYSHEGTRARRVKYGVGKIWSNGVME
jgi:hypothetical protein